MKLRHLEAALGRVKPFDEPKVELEQYPTSAHLAARMLFAAAQQGDVEGLVVADLGCGTAMLSCAAELCGAGSTIGLDIDEDALRVARENLDEVGAETELVRCDVTSCPLRASRPRPGAAAGDCRSRARARSGQVRGHCDHEPAVRDAAQGSGHGVPPRGHARAWRRRSRARRGQRR